MERRTVFLSCSSVVHFHPASSSSFGAVVVVVCGGGGGAATSPLSFSSSSSSWEGMVSCTSESTSCRASINSSFLANTAARGCGNENDDDGEEEEDKGEANRKEGLDGKAKDKRGGGKSEWDGSNGEAEAVVRSVTRSSWTGASDERGRGGDDAGAPAAASAHDVDSPSHLSSFAGFDSESVGEEERGGGGREEERCAVARGGPSSSSFSLGSFLWWSVSAVPKSVSGPPLEGSRTGSSSPPPPQEEEEMEERKEGKGEG